MPSPTHPDSPWFVVNTPRPHARLRLFCFHHAGGGASTYRTWGKDLPADIEVAAVQLPGRESRFGQVLLNRMGPLTAQLAQALETWSEIPFAFFGHSMGAVVSYELTRRLRREGRQGPRLLMVSGRRAPHTSPIKGPMWNLPDAEFMARLRELGGTPEEVLREPELMALLTRILRADFAVNDTWVYTPEPPLDLPVTALYARSDEEVTGEQMSAWCTLTTGPFEMITFPGGHFYLGDQRERILSVVEESIKGVI